MILLQKIKLGMRLEGSFCWEPMSYGSYAALVHAWRAIDDSWSPMLGIMSYELADEAGVVFG